MRDNCKFEMCISGTAFTHIRARIGCEKLGDGYNIYDYRRGLTRFESTITDIAEQTSISCLSMLRYKL